MKIAVLTNIVTGTQERGGKVHATQIARGLMKRGHVLYTNLSSESDDFIKIDEEGFFRRGKEIDVFYIRIDGWHEKDKLTLYRMSNAKAPCIWELNSPLEELRLEGINESRLRMWNLERKDLAGMADCAICVSEEMGRYAREFLGVKRIQVIPNGSDHRLFNPIRKKDGLFPIDRFNVIWVGSPEYPWQGIGIIRNLAERLWEVDKEIALHVTDSGKNSPNLSHLGRIPYDRMPEYISSADAGLCIYDLDKYRPIGGFYGSPLKLFDYMACGLPVIGTDVGQIRQVIEKNHCGLLTDNSPSDIVEKLLRLKREAALGKAMGARGRKAVEEEHNWDLVVDRTSVAMEELIRSEPGEQRRRSFRNRQAFMRYRMNDAVRRLARRFSVNV